MNAGRCVPLACLTKVPGSLACLAAALGPLAYNLIKKKAPGPGFIAFFGGGEGGWVTKIFNLKEKILRV